MTFKDRGAGVSRQVGVKESADRRGALIDFQRIISNFHSDKPAAPQEVTALLNRQHEVSCYAMGRNEDTLALTEHVGILGVVDDFGALGERWRGLPVISSCELPPGACVVNCSTSISPVSADRRIRSVPGVSCVMLADLYRPSGSPVAPPDFVREARAELSDREVELRWVHSSLSDAESRRVFNDLMSYRLTGDYRFMESYVTRLSDQYFEPFLGALNDSTFVDCGGFDGDTTEEFVRRYPQYRKVFLFEPSATNIDKAKARLDRVRDIEFVPLGVSDHEEVLNFDSGSGSACAVSDVGDSQIRLVSLDHYTDDRLSFVKMDLEGWESRALKGAERHIQNDKPILAIAVYHHISDFWQIPEFVLSLHPDYKVYLRHYTEGWSESVMYFVP
ncbi:FkbM family methyltransferase [Marinobacter sp. PE14]